MHCLKSRILYFHETCINILRYRFSVDKFGKCLSKGMSSAWGRLWVSSELLSTRKTHQPGTFTCLIIKFHNLQNKKRIMVKP